MFFSESFIDELKQRLPISSVIGTRVKLQKRGQQHIGLCPFHQEKTPSFTLQDQRGSYYCFGCHAHGDIIQFVSAVDHLSFNDTITYLANLAGMSIPVVSEIEQKKVELKNDLLEVVKKSAEWFAQQLKLSTNHHVLEYLQKRGLNEDDIKKFSLGYAPGKGLIDFLRKQGFSNKSIFDAGLSIKLDNKSNEYMERFRNRVIFPIINIKKQVVGFGGRALDDSLPKYLNSPETALFKKNNLLYAENIASSYAFKNNRLIVVEGYMDAIFMHKAGLGETVAALGTAFNQIHLERLWKMANEPILCFDGDNAGKKAMLKAAHIALPILSPGLSLRFSLLPKGKDPDEIINTYGPNYMKNLLDNSVTLSDFIWQTEHEQMKQDNPETRSLFEHKLYELVANIKNPIVRTHYKKYIKDKLWKTFNQSFYKKNIVKLDSPLIISKTLSVKERLEYSLFAQLIVYSELLKDDIIFEHFSHFEIANEELEKLRIVLLSYYENKQSDLNNLLFENNLTRIADFISGPNSSFIDIISKIDIIKAKNIWVLTYKKYLLELLREEYSFFMKQAHQKDSAYDKATELKKAIDILTLEIKEKENELSPEQI
jgi:DNA primase